ncbi:unnamed protein product [Citrullus colocynthis]|uniref:Alcohol dehydrogenase n=1 Tax=Citrullus colocynthis TaxID=252529 RepID=A0ABP0Y1M8_9ROSI
MDKATLFGCGVPTGIGAAWKVADVDEGSTVAIFGLGIGWGKTVILGVEKDGAAFKVKSFDIINGITITGALFGGLKPISDFPMLINKFLDKELYLDELISHEVGFEDINKAFDLLLSGKSLRCLIWIHDSNPSS